MARRKRSSRYDGYGYGGFAPYVPVAERRAKAAKAMAARQKKGLTVEPVALIGRGRSIATTFWGKAWCTAIESQAALSNRLDRGRTYVRNGSVAHLSIAPGEITAVVSGSELYDARITVKPLDGGRWKRLRDACAGQVRSSLDLLQGKLGDAALQVLTRAGDGMLPLAGELSMRCSCPDGAWMCKHLAAVLYGVGARLDARPELLFTLRKVPMTELISDAGRAVAKGSLTESAIDASALGDIFGIDLADDAPPIPPRAASGPASASAPVATLPAKRPGRAAPVNKRAVPTLAPALSAKKRAVAKELGERAAGAISNAKPGQELMTADLRERGYTPAQIKRLVADGALEKTGHGWYRVPD